MASGDSRKDGIVYTDNAQSVVITIRGEAFANLKEITTIFNRWDDNDKSCAEMIRTFGVMDFFENLGRRRPELPEQTLPGMICGSYCETSDVGALRAAFESAGFSTNF